VIWLDSAEEAETGLESRVRKALADPSSVSRFGGLSLGESTHLVDEVSPLETLKTRLDGLSGRAFLLADSGRLTLPVWVDHVGSTGTRYVTGNLVEAPVMEAPIFESMPRILANS
jgi:CRISPR-associated protein Cas5t